MHEQHQRSTLPITETKSRQGKTTSRSHAARWLALAVLLVAGGIPEVARASKIVLQTCEVSIRDEAQVPAEEAGVIIALEPNEGDYVEAGALLGHIKDDQAKAELILAQKEEQLARFKADNDLEIELGLKTELFRKFEYDQIIEANKRHPGAKSETEKNTKAYEWEKAKLQTKNARLDKQMNECTAEAKAAQVKVADEGLKRREIHAPISGKVVKRLLHVGEWANPGDPVLHIVRVDRLRVAGAVNPKEYGPSDLNNRAIEFHVELAGGRSATFQGKVAYVNFEADPGGERLKVVAEVVNRQENDEWLLLPGSIGEMVINLDQAAEREPATTSKPPMEKPARR